MIRHKGLGRRGRVCFTPLRDAKTVAECGSPDPVRRRPRRWREPLNLLWCNGLRDLTPIWSRPCKIEGGRNCSNPGENANRRV